MKATKKQSNRGCRSDRGNRHSLEVVIVSKQDAARFDALLKERHYLGWAKPTGDFLRQVAVRDGKWVGLLAWGAACYSIKDRDRWIGWSPTLRAQRQKLIVQNRRFLLLVDKGQEPNLASQVLGAAVRRLPEHWQARFGYRPLLAETFTDIEQFQGTCYKAAGWEAVGHSKGYGRHRADFYVRHDRPKKLWLKKLHPEATALLCAPQLPPEYAGGGQCNAHGVLPLELAQCRSLMEALQQVPDHRAGNTQFRIGSLLSIVAMALLSGCRDLSAIHRFGQRLSQPQRGRIGLPRKRGTRFYKIPCYSVYYRLLERLDLDAFARVLSEWLSDQNGRLPGCLALDGKMVRDVIGVVSLVDQETGAPVAMKPMSQKEGEGNRCEMKVAEDLLENGPVLDTQVVTADALHAQTETARPIVERGGDYLFQLKGNRKNLFEHAQKAGDQATPLLNKPKPDTDG